MDETKGTVERVGGYRVVRRLATGGTSDVLLAKAEGPLGFERTVVLKLLLSKYRNDDEFAKMFAREAAAYARLSHPAIVQLFDFFQVDGQLVMVLEYVDGAPLSRLRGMLKAVGQNIDDKAAIFIAERIFSALAAAHDSMGEGGRATPVIHRDVNPSNVLVPWDGNVKLADFGIAKVTGVTHESAAGLIKGTFGYMAPEQVEGGAVTPRADVYAAGIILWELLTRRRAFQRGALPEIEVLRAMAEPRITSIDILRPDVDRTVREAINRALVPKADKRVITSDEVVSILRDVIAPDEGRERLASLLASVRHEPKPANTSLPPPNTDPMPARPGSARPQPPRPIGSPKRSPSGALPVVTTPKLPTKTATGIGPLKPPQPAAPPEPLSSSALVEQTEPVTLPGRESEKMRLATPLQAIAPGLTLKDAIDEILTSVPSSIPPSVLSSRNPSPLKSVYPPSTPPPPTAGPETPRMIPIPAPPAPILNVTMPLGRTMPLSPSPGATQPAPPVAPEAPLPSAPPLVSMPPAIGAAIAEALGQAPVQAPAQAGFDKAMREIERAEQPTVMPVNAPNAGIPSVAAEPPTFERTLVLDPSPQIAAPPAPPSMDPPPFASAPPPIAATGSHDAILPQPKPSSVGIIAFMIVIAIAAGVAGTVLYVRHKQAATTPITTSIPTATTSVASPFVPPSAPTASSSAPASASASASGPASAEPPPSASPSASVAPVASASASASAAPATSATASAAPSGEIPPGMGVIKTAGAAANRRIFVDDKVVGQTPESVTVKCGSHTVKVGSAGKPQTIDIPCGAEITVSDR